MMIWGYIVFALLFLVGLVGYWVVTWPLRDLDQIYLPDNAN
jgi:hypothetical protein